MDDKILLEYIKNYWLWTLCGYSLPLEISLGRNKVDLKKLWESRLWENNISKFEKQFINHLSINFPNELVIREFPILIPNKKKWKKMCKMKGIKEKEDTSLFYLDFFFPEYSLAIEVDGNQHLLQRTYDKERDKVIKNYGINVIRFPNYGGNNPETTNKCNEILLRELNPSKKSSPVPLDFSEAALEQFKEVYKDEIELADLIHNRFFSLSVVELNNLEVYRLGKGLVTNIQGFENFYNNLFPDQTLKIIYIT